MLYCRDGTTWLQATKKRRLKSRPPTTWCEIWMRPWSEKLIWRLVWIMHEYIRSN